MPKKKTDTPLDFTSLATWSLDLQRAEQDGHEHHRVILTGPDGESIHSGPTAKEALDTARAAVQIPQIPEDA